MEQDTNNNRNCLNCKYFTSFKEDYCDDMEPDNEGFCHNPDSPRFGNEGAGEGYVCYFHSFN